MLPFGSLRCRRPEGAERLTADLGTSRKGHRCKGCLFQVDTLTVMMMKGGQQKGSILVGL